MSCQYNLLFLFLCGFAALSVSTETCGKDLLVGTSCIIKLTTKNNEKPSEIKWVHDTRSGYILRRKGGKIREESEGVSMEEDGSLRFLSVSLNDTGKYSFNAFDADGTEIGRGEVEIKVYGNEVKKAVGDEVSFRPVTSIIWKHRSSSDTIVKVIEWDDHGARIPNPRFKDITTLDTETGQITLTNLTVEHSGVYTIDINGKEQEQRFILSVMEPVPKPEKSAVNPNVVYLRCENSDKVIGKDSTRGERKCSAFHLKGESITEKNEGNPENFYTCTPDNSASKETSDPL